MVSTESIQLNAYPHDIVNINLLILLVEFDIVVVFARTKRICLVDLGCFR